MKALILLHLLLFNLLFQLSAQPTGGNDKSLVGTWIKTSDSLEEIKIISPTHVFFFVYNRKVDSFAYAGAGTYSTNGNKYTENLQYANFEFIDGGYSFDYKVEGDKFQHTGVVTLKDGTKASINNTFTRVKPAKTYDGPHVGTWNQLSSSFTNANGKGSHTNATHIRFQVISPSYFSRISLANNKFENSFGGPYTLDGNKINCKIEYSSVPFLVGAVVTITQRSEGDKLFWSGVAKDKDGKQIGQFEDEFERVIAKSPAQ